MQIILDFWTSHTQATYDMSPYCQLLLLGSPPPLNSVIKYVVPLGLGYFNKSNVQGAQHQAAFLFGLSHIPTFNAAKVPESRTFTRKGGAFARSSVSACLQQ